MAVAVVVEPVAVLPAYGRVSSAFWVESRLRVDSVHGGLGGLALVEEPVEPPVLKDYDQEAGAGPERWLVRWDISHWGVFSAFQGPRRVGGAVIAWRTPGVHMLEGRDDLAVLWDLRVDPAWRERGVGSALFARAAAWAGAKGCRRLKIETQNVNVPACRFYAKQGCELAGIRRCAYADLLDEAQLLWYLEL
jgi:ribosomal protein S18 acetylase RimI-like enzyme